MVGGLGQQMGVAGQGLLGQTGVASYTLGSTQLGSGQPQYTSQQLGLSTLQVCHSSVHFMHKIDTKY